MPTKKLDPQIVKLTSLSKEEQKELIAADVATLEDLSYLSFEDIEKAMPSANVVKLRKLEQIGMFHCGKGVLTDEMTISDVRDAVLVLAAPQAANQDPNAGVPYSSDVNRGAPKMYVNSLEKFEGKCDQYDWSDAVCVPVDGCTKAEQSIGEEEKRRIILYVVRGYPVGGSGSPREESR